MLGIFTVSLNVAVGNLLEEMGFLRTPEGCVSVHDSLAHPKEDVTVIRRLSSLKTLPLVMSLFKKDRKIGGKAQPSSPDAQMNEENVLMGPKKAKGRSQSHKQEEVGLVMSFYFSNLTVNLQE